MEKTKIDQLKALGLREAEIKVYLYLLENGVASPTTIAKKIGILRPNCYSILDQLEEKGLVTIQKQGSKRVYVAQNPNALLNMLDAKRETLTHDLLPDLIGMFKSQKNKPVIKFYEGKNSIEEVFAEMYEAETIYGFTSTEKLFKHFGSFMKKWRAELVKRKIFLRDILTESSTIVTKGVTKKDLDVYFDYRIMPEKFNDLNVDILTWNNKVAIFTIEEPFLGTLIEHHDIAHAFTIMHRIMWMSLKKVEMI